MYLGCKFIIYHYLFLNNVGNMQRLNLILYTNHIAVWYMYFSQGLNKINHYYLANAYLN